jgi:hypothetical protein
MVRNLINLTALVLLALAGVRASAQAPPGTPSPLMDRDKEFQMAVVSAPPEIRDSTGVYVLEEHGFIKVRDSRNGFNCIVERRARHLSPMCHDAEGSTSTLQATLMRGDLLMKGTDPVEIERGSMKRIGTDISTRLRKLRLHAFDRRGLARSKQWWCDRPYRASHHGLRALPQELGHRGDEGASLENQSRLDPVRGTHVRLPDLFSRWHLGPTVGGLAMQTGRHPTATQMDNPTKNLIGDTK